MNGIKVMYSCSILVIAGVLVSISICKPSLLASNAFLKDFINHEILNIHAVIVTVTLVSITQIHLEFSKIERKFDRKIFDDSRREVNRTTSILVGTLIVMVVILIWLGGLSNNDTMTSLLMSFNIVLLFSGVLAMVDIIRTIYIIASEMPSDSDLQLLKDSKDES